MSLSYASADNTAGSASPAILADVLIPDNNEFVVMSDKPCSNGDCGTVRDGTVAYRKFAISHFAPGSCLALTECRWIWWCF